MTLWIICQYLSSSYYCFIGKQVKVMANIREILARNLKENRRKCGVSQSKLAEMADLSTHYIAMIELSRKFPSSETLERMAAALGIETHELFAVSPSPESALERLHDAVLSDIGRVVAKSIKDAFAEESKAKGKT
jgi:transcriptional regulator with XRE-family HTH domain